MIHVSIHKEIYIAPEPVERISARWNEIALAKPTAKKQTREYFTANQRLGLILMDLRKCWMPEDGGQPVWAAICDTYYQGFLRFAVNDADAIKLQVSPCLTYEATTADGPNVIGNTEKIPGIVQPVYLTDFFNDGGVTDYVELNLTDAPCLSAEPAPLMLGYR